MDENGVQKFQTLGRESNDSSRCTPTEHYNEIKMLRDILPETSKTRWCYS